MSEEKTAKNQNMMTKKELVDAVAKASSVAPKEARGAVDVTLNTIAEALAAGKNVNAAPLGRITNKLARAGTEREKRVIRIVPARIKDDAEDA